MGIGVAILLIAVGAILSFAVDAEVSGVDIAVVGWILMGAGVLGLFITLAMSATHRRSSSVSERRVYDDRSPGGRVVEEQRTFDDRPPPPTI